MERSERLLIRKNNRNNNNINNNKHAPRSVAAVLFSEKLICGRNVSSGDSIRSNSVVYVWNPGALPPHERRGMSSPNVFSFGACAAGVRLDRQFDANKRHAQAGTHTVGTRAFVSCRTLFYPPLSVLIPWVTCVDLGAGELDRARDRVNPHGAVRRCSWLPLGRYKVVVNLRCASMGEI